ncbi:MAG: ABC transporter ATP-binding protein [Gemmatimonadota bacterium]|nr:ABC transporter ATP-binding protein [Gemmatimonadota bacterium]
MGELRTLLPYFRPYRRGFVLGLVCVVFANGFQVAGPWLLKLAIDGIGDPEVTRARITGLAGLIVLVALIGGAFRYGMRELLNGISRRMEADLRNDFFGHLLRLDPSFYGRTRTGDLMSRATNDTLAVRMAVGPAVMYTVNTVVTFTLTLGLMIWMSPRLTLYAVLPLLALPPIMIRFGKIIHERFERIQEQFSSMSTFVQENLTGVRIVRAYGQEAEQARRFDAFNERYRQRNMALIVSTGAFRPLLMFISGLSMVVVTWLGGLQVIAGTITVGTFVAFTFYLTLLVWPMIALGWVVNLYQRGAASMGRINRILRTEPEITAPPQPRRLSDPRGEIRFEGVSFAYPGTDRVVLRDIEFTARAGATVALVGPTGAGKSTLVSLLPRLYDPTEGRILFDGIPLPELDPAELRAHLAMVPQDAFLFSDSIAANIGLGHREEPDRGSVEAAARIAQLDDQVRELPHGYDTLLGERGINLSGGQKQRATLARALAREPTVLVLDDALSAVDTQTEARILDDLRSITSSRTTFIISHRVSAVMHADLILVLEAGRIVQRGRHTDLIAEGGTYARLLERQLLEEDLESGVAGARR